MGFNDQVRNMAYGSENKKFIFKEGVRFKRMGGKNPTTFRILPAFDPANPDPRTSCAPFVMPNGELTNWGTVVHISRYIGHGQNRRDILSLKSFGEQDPMDILLQTVNAIPEWGYLTRDVGEGKSAIRKAISRASSTFLANIWDINQASQEIAIGVFSTSAAKAFLDSKSGLIYQRTNLPPEVLAQNYLLQYAVGDLTHHTNGPALCIAKGNDKGEMSSFQVFLASDSQNRVITRAVNQEQLAQRYDMNNMRSFLEVPTEEDIINQLITLFNQRSPAGYHEYSLLRQAFPSYPIPEPPSAPAASNTVASGFGSNPAVNQAPVNNYARPATAPMGTPVPQAQPQGYSLPPQGYAPSAMPNQAPAPAPEAAKAASNMAQYAQPQDNIPMGMTPAQAAPAPAPMAAPQGPAPVIPGDSIPSVGIPTSQFSKEAFLAKLNVGR